MVRSVVIQISSTTIMAWAILFVTIGCTLQTVISDGYAKNILNSNPGSSSWSTGGSSDTRSGVSQSYGPPGYHQMSTGHYGLPVSTDYVSRYYGPVAVPVVLSDGTLANTPEVEAARAAHLAALSKAKALWYGKMDDGSYDSYKYGDYKYGWVESTHTNKPTGTDLWQVKKPGHYGLPVSTDYVSRYYGPVAVPVVLSDGTLANTPEVEAARAAHLAALSKAKALWYGKMDDGSYDPYKYGDYKYGWVESTHTNKPTGTDTWQVNKPYSGPLAIATVLPSGYLADTSDITTARTAHLQALYQAHQEAVKWKQWS